MKMMQIFACVCAGTIGLASLSYAGPHDAAPMLVSPKASVAGTKTGASNAAVKKFYDAYQESGAPSIAIFWNHAFDDKVSQWESSQREIVTGEKAIDATDFLKKNGDLTQEEIDRGYSLNTPQPSGGDIDTYSRVIKGGSKILSTKQTESRVEEKKRASLSETDQFTFSSAFVQEFINQDVKVLDRAAIIRIIERDMVRESGAEIVADIKKIETEALVGYADLLAEVLLAEDQKSYLVTVKEVSTGRLITSFKSNGRGENKNKWVSTSNGYQKKSTFEFNTLEQVGKQLAIETMTHLSGVIGDL